MLSQTTALPGSQVLYRLWGHRGGSCLWQAVPRRLWELVGTPLLEGEGGPKLVVGILSHSAASTHMHVSPKSLRPHTVKSQASAQAHLRAGQQLQNGRAFLS